MNHKTHGKDVIEEAVRRLSTTWAGALFRSLRSDIHFSTPSIIMCLRNVTRWWARILSNHISGWQSLVQFCSYALLWRHSSAMVDTTINAILLVSLLHSWTWVMNDLNCIDSWKFVVLCKLYGKSSFKMFLYAELHMRITRFSLWSCVNCDKYRIITLAKTTGTTWMLLKVIWLSTNYTIIVFFFLPISLPFHIEIGHFSPRLVYNELYHSLW